MVSSISGSGMSGTNPLQQAMRQLFSKNDENTDGKLSTDEIGSLLETLQGASSGDGEVTSDKVVSAFDTDGDGQVSGSEFDAGFKKLAENMQGDMIAMQEAGQGAPPPPPPGPPPGGMSASSSTSSDDEDDEDETTVADLLKLLESYSTDSDESSTAEASSSDTLLQTFLSQLEQYAQNQHLAQDYRSGYQARQNSLSVSA